MAIEDILNISADVLNHGKVVVIGAYGDDNRIVQAARVSYGKGTKSVREDAQLIDYLMRHEHNTPFEMADITLLLKMPLFVARQWHRHRTASINEYSCRYSEPIEDVYTPEEERIKGKGIANKQGSEGELDERSKQIFLKVTASAQSVTKQAMQMGKENGIANELNRINMLVSNYTEFYWKVNARNLMHFLALRLDPHAQEEIKAYAEVIAHIFQEWMPATFAAFEKHMLNRVKFSSYDVCEIADMPEFEIIINALKAKPQPEHYSKGEWQELITKLCNMQQYNEQLKALEAAEPQV